MVKCIPPYYSTFRFKCWTIKSASRIIMSAPIILNGIGSDRPPQSTNFSGDTSTAVRNATIKSIASSSSDGAAVIADEIFWTYVAVVCVTGVLLNAIVIRSLFRTKLNGTLHFILQLAVSDIISLFVGAVELRYMQHRRWTFPADTCPIYLGIESVCSTATFYLLVAINLHAISTFNLARKTIRREAKHEDASSHQYAPIAQSQPPDNDDYEVTIDMAESPPQSRSLTINYSQPEDRVYVMFPLMFVWCLAASVSTPLYVLGSVMPNERMPLICGIVNFDADNSQLMQVLFVAVRIVIPAACLTLTIASVASKLTRLGESIRPCGLNEDVGQVLRIAMYLSLMFLVFSCQRIIGSLLFEVWTRTPFMLFKYPKINRVAGIVLDMLHWSASSVRPILYVIVEPNIRANFFHTIGFGRRSKTDASTESTSSSDRNKQRLL